MRPDIRSKDEEHLSKARPKCQEYEQTDTSCSMLSLCIINSSTPINCNAFAQERPTSERMPAEAMMWRPRDLADHGANPPFVSERVCCVVAGCLAARIVAHIHLSSANHQNHTNRQYYSTRTNRLRLLIVSCHISDDTRSNSHIAK